MYIRKNIQRIRQIEEEWRQASKDGYTVFSALIDFTIEQQYMESPYWGALAESETVKQRVAEKISRHVLDSISSLHNLIESRMVRHTNRSSI